MLGIYERVARNRKNWSEFCGKAVRHDETIKIAIEFCTEVAVLLSVFPWLEVYVASHAYGGSGSQGAGSQNSGVSGWFIVLCSASALAFFAAAVIIGIKRPRKEEPQ